MFPLLAYWHSMPTTLTALGCVTIEDFVCSCFWLLVRWVGIGKDRKNIQKRTRIDIRLCIIIDSMVYHLSPGNTRPWSNTFHEALLLTLRHLDTIEPAVLARVSWPRTTHYIRLLHSKIMPFKAPSTLWSVNDPSETSRPFSRNPRSCS